MTFVCFHLSKRKFVLTVSKPGRGQSWDSLKLACATQVPPSSLELLTRSSILAPPALVSLGLAPGLVAGLRNSLPDKGHATLTS